MKIYLLFLICVISYFTRVIYKNYQKGLPLGYGQNKIFYFTILLCIVTGQYIIPSTVSRLIVFLLFDLLFLLIYTIVGIHNRANHSGDELHFFERDVKKAQICACIGIGLILSALLLVCFTE